MNNIKRLENVLQKLSALKDYQEESYGDHDHIIKI